MAIILIYYHRNIPSYLGLGARVLLLLFFFTGVMCNEVLVPRNIDAVLGKNITLGCQIQVGSNLSLTQSSWERRVASSTVTLAVYNPEFGTSITDEYVGRLSFLSASRHDATVLLENVDFADAGVYTCKVATFPMGNKQASTTVNIMVEPKVYVSASSAPLLDGGNETVVATCRAERALPPAEVSWESDLFGRSQEHQQKESDGTATTWVSYSWRPTRHTQKLSLTCVVRHPALQTELRSTHWLNVQFAPEIVLKSIGDWLVGGTDSHLQCRANANPPVGSLTWSRLDGPMPEGVDVVNGTLYFMRPLQQNDSGVYRCTVENDIDTRSRETRVWIRARPSVQINEAMTLENGTHYQKVTCSAAGGKPEAVVSWLVYDQEPNNVAFSVTTETLQHSNSTFTQTSTLHLPMHLMHEGNVTCVVNHPALANSTHVKVKVQTFVTPVVTMNTTLLQDEGEEFQVVTCKAMNGRPAARLSWSLSGDTAEARNISMDVGSKIEMDMDTDTETAISSRRFPAHLHEGWNITCMVMHPTFPSEQRRTVTFPTYRFSAMRVLTPNGVAVRHVLVDEGQSNVTFQLEVTGNVPRYQVNCIKEDGPLSADMNVMGSSLQVMGPVGLHHAGKYKCQASYYNHKASVELEMQVAPREVQEAPVAPNVTIQTWEETNHRIIQCSAADAVPVANVSWVLPEGLLATIRPNSTLQNSAHTVSVALLLPVCLSEEHRVQCVIEHPALLETDIREMTIPACLAGPEVNVSITTTRENGTRYTLVTCRADSNKPAATITWSLSDDHGGNSISWSEGVQTANWTSPSGSATVVSTAPIPTLSFFGRTLACIVTHKALAEPVRRETWIPAVDPPKLSVSFIMHPNSPLCLIVCESSWEMGTFNLSWVLPLNNTGRAVQRSGNVTGRFWANSTYEFLLDLHEGQNLTCQVKNEHISAEKTVHIPQYYISSLKLLNPVSSTAVQRVSLKMHLHNQRISLKVCGKIPAFNITCVRSDDSPVRTKGAAIVFPSPVSLHDAGLYTCRASFHHHSATLSVQVEVTEEDQELCKCPEMCIKPQTAQK
uniref:Nectin cell adhesion molecule 3 n=1 Tax=Paramormyrops kingsleyae TaxID=1676925 RepID=A0A3B3QU47_9TELE